MTSATSDGVYVWREVNAPCMVVNVGVIGFVEVQVNSEVEAPVEKAAEMFGFRKGTIGRQ